MSNGCLVYYLKSHIRSALLMLISTLLLLQAIPVSAAEKNILVLVSKDSSSYRNVVSALTSNSSNSSNLTLKTIYLPERPNPASLQQYDLILAIGTKATREALKLTTDTPVLSTFIPRRTFHTLVNRDKALKQRLQQGQLGALYLEQPFQRQLQLLALLKPNTKTVATIIGPSSKDERWPLEQAIALHNWDLALEQLDKNDNPIEKLTPLIANSDAFLAIPDKSVFNRSTAKWILLMTFRQRIPLIAYSKRYVDAGAIAAVFSTPQTIGNETALLIEQWCSSKSKSLPAPTYPNLFDISVNQGTARSLRMQLPSTTELKQRLEEQ